MNNYRADAQRIFIRNNVTQGHKSMFFELKDISLCNALPDEAYICGNNAYQLSIIRENRAVSK